MDTVTFAFTCAGLSSALLMAAAYRGKKQRTRNDEIVQARADRAADAARRVGGYDELVELERHRRNGWRSLGKQDVVSDEEKEKT